MSVTTIGRKNKNGTSARTCNCGSWKQHWINASGKPWPKTCSIAGCDNDAEVGAHIINKDVSGEYIVPACKSCNNSTSAFSLKPGITLISANKQKTCKAK